MKIICAWCKSLIGYKCPLCGEPLTQDPINPTMLICRSRGTPISFSTKNMTESHGICPECLTKFREHKKRLCPLTPEEIIAQAEAEDLDIERRIQDAANLTVQIAMPATNRPIPFGFEPGLFGEEDENDK